MEYRTVLELAEYGAWKRLIEADAKHHAPFMKSLRESVDEKELDRLENDLDIALEEHAAIRHLIDSLKSF